MIVGLPREIKNNENRVGMVPAGVKALVKAGHQVLVQAGAGIGSGFSDENYAAAGAQVLDSAPEVWHRAEIVVKVKEPLPEEYHYFREGLILFTYLHLAAAGDLVFKLMEHKVKAVAYETIQLPDGSLPLLQPMSEVAGRMSVQIGAHFLEKAQGGRGVLLGGVPGVEAGNVVIVGGGIVGTNAAKMAVGLRARVTILENNPKRLRELEDLFGATVQVLMSHSYNIEKSVARADLLVGAVLIPGAKAPHLVTEEMVKTMKPGSVIVDVAIDQGGCIETIDRVTTHDHPTYVKHGVVHYCVANMPGAVPYTSTLALTNATLPYLMQLAGKGLERAAAENSALKKGVNVLGGKVTYRAVAEAFGLEVGEW
ncbi:alanine dehydrogenase [Acididesulfobacillus acetoxydans]|uniref:Alanine dehydrogenase n=1 Tax=Acididesulfobacillus acetoxydans TaxID=1561005 RepID=A0A8S0W2B4_9FIRM|nr:alanine dehydrogenase [Acididesulfobacillus acetoxydans]CAA7600578.1 alanine dehydrogenase [Acididesulfobacillus acetoxydans]CEJ06712.1 Alanine dehydrogenase [Acididesulfobacillus acetoxydans]